MIIMIYQQNKDKDHMSSGSSRFMIISDLVEANICRKKPNHSGKNHGLLWHFFLLLTHKIQENPLNPPFFTVNPPFVGQMCWSSPCILQRDARQGGAVAQLRASAMELLESEEWEDPSRARRWHRGGEHFTEKIWGNSRKSGGIREFTMIYPWFIMLHHDLSWLIHDLPVIYDDSSMIYPWFTMIYQWFTHDLPVIYPHSQTQKWDVPTKRFGEADVSRKLSVFEDWRQQSGLTWDDCPTLTPRFVLLPRVLPRCWIFEMKNWNL